MSDRGSTHPPSNAETPEISATPEPREPRETPVTRAAEPPTASSPQPFEIDDQPFSLTGYDEHEGHDGRGGHDGHEGHEQNPRSKVRRIVLLSLLAVGLIGAATVVYAGWQISSQKDASLTAPAQIGSLTLDESEDGKSTADYLQTALAAEIDLDKAIGAVYADPAKNNVLFLGATGLIWSPEKDLDTAFGLISDNQGAVTDLHKVDPGKLGGTMKCGTTKSDDGDLAVCGWADHGSVALAMFPGHTTTDSAALLLKIREATEIRS